MARSVNMTENFKFEKLFVLICGQCFVYFHCLSSCFVLLLNTIACCLLFVVYCLLFISISLFVFQLSLRFPSTCFCSGQPRDLATSLSNNDQVHRPCHWVVYFWLLYSPFYLFSVCFHLLLVNS